MDYVWLKAMSPLILCKDDRTSENTRKKPFDNVNNYHAYATALVTGDLGW